MVKHWLMKAEPDSRIVKGKDVKFSVDDFESTKTTPWEGVRNAEARNLMKEMRLGDKVLFYHSNCKNPGIAAFAEVSKEAYPDYTAWDSTHPYYDPKTDKENPKWYMVDVTFKHRAANFVPLSLLRRIAASADVPSDIPYIGAPGVRAIKEMALVTRGRLSVQRVEEATWRIVELLAANGGWDDGADKKVKKRHPKAQPKDVSHEGKGSTSNSIRAEESTEAPSRRSTRSRAVHS
ncbi:PUA-like domain-containing protein [Irpex rosettiformis]|uniref:PUA-like domain-containing protein n=1 Tax=Irpex rosettiformis TaxID=378272 RepID=A0ACB8UCY5_9APHY|nr:PUA-like domain-containing protein [Irpex rosettiformis]